MSEYRDESYWAKEAGKASADNAFLKLRIKKLEAQLAAIAKLPRFVMGVSGNDATAYLNSNGEYDNEDNWIKAKDLEDLLDGL